MALVEGRLSPDVDAAEVLRIPLDNAALVGPSGDALRDMLSRVREERELSPAARRRARLLRERAQARARRASPPPSEEELAAEALREALASYLILPTSQQTELLHAHAARRAAAERQQQLDRPRVQVLTDERDALEAYLRGELDPSVDPRGLLQLDLSQSEELGASLARSVRFLTGEPPAASAGAEEAAVNPALARAEAALDASRQKLLALSDAQRSALAAQHRRRQRAFREAQEAESQAAALAAQRSEAASEVHHAADAREAALEEARRARSTALRRVAEERARLLGVRERQARRAVALDEQLAEDEERRTQVAALRAEVVALDQRSLLEGEKFADARALLVRVHARWNSTRSVWHQLQRHIANGELSVPSPGELPSNLVNVPDELLSLHAELAGEAERLRDRVHDQQARIETDMHDDAVALNRARLTLLDLVKPDVRDSFTAFGSQGVAETRREAEQIGAGA